MGSFWLWQLQLQGGRSGTGPVQNQRKKGQCEWQPQGGTLWLSHPLPGLIPNPSPSNGMSTGSCGRWQSLCWERVLGTTWACKGHPIAFLPAAVSEFGCSQGGSTGILVATQVSRVHQQTALCSSLSSFKENTGSNVTKQSF